MRSSTNLRSSTTGSDGARHSACSARSSTSFVTPTTRPAIKQADRARPGAHESGHQTRGDSSLVGVVIGLGTDASWFSDSGHRSR